MPDPDPTPDPTPDPAPDPTPDPTPDPKPDELGPGGKAAIEAERAIAKAAEKRAKDAEKALAARVKADETETDRLKREADEGKQAAATATEKLRKANLLTALTDAQVKNPKAAARLLDNVDYDDDDEPTNLEAAITAAKANYGDDLFKAAKPKAPDLNGGSGGDKGDPPSLSADELAAAKASGMTPEEYASYKDPTYRPPDPKQ